MGIIIIISNINNVEYTAHSSYIRTCDGGARLPTTESLFYHHDYCYYFYWLECRLKRTFSVLKWNVQYNVCWTCELIARTIIIIIQHHVRHRLCTFPDMRIMGSSRITHLCHIHVYILRYYDIIYYIILDMAKYDAPFSFQLFYLDDRQQIYNNNYNNGNSRRLREWALLFSFDTRRILYFNYRVINKSAWMQPMLNDDYDNGHNISYLFNNSNCSNRAWNGSLKIEWCNFGMDASQNWFSSHKQAALHPVVTIIASQLIGKLVLHAGYSIGRQCELFITACMHAK